MDIGHWQNHPLKREVAFASDQYPSYLQMKQLTVYLLALTWNLDF